MNGSTHFLIGGAAGWLLAFHVDATPGFTLLAIGAAAAGALLPDIDTPHSTVSHKAGLARLPFILLSHRGVTHSLLALLVVAYFCLELGFGGWAFTLGYASHIVADMLTRAGCPLLWPLRKRFRLLPRF